MKLICYLLAASLIPAAALADQQRHYTATQGVEKSAVHQGTGKVVAVDRAKLSIKLAHEAIKSLGWPGMTMDFTVADAALLDGIKGGDTVTFELGKDAKTGKWLITRITPQGAKLPAVN